MNIVEQTVKDVGIETYWVRHLEDKNVTVYMCQTGHNFLVTWDVTLGSERHGFPITFSSHPYVTPKTSVVIDTVGELANIIRDVSIEAYKGYPNARALQSNAALPFLGFTKVFVDHAV